MVREIQMTLLSFMNGAEVLIVLLLLVGLGGTWIAMMRLSFYSGLLLEGISSMAVLMITEYLIYEPGLSGYFLWLVALLIFTAINAFSRIVDYGARLSIRKQAQKALSS